MENPNTFCDWDKEYAAKFKSMAVWIDLHMASGVCQPPGVGVQTTADSAALMWRTLEVTMSESEALGGHPGNKPLSILPSNADEARPP
jgi:hypothetical protein